MKKKKKKIKKRRIIRKARPKAKVKRRAKKPKKTRAAKARTAKRSRKTEIIEPQELVHRTRIRVVGIGGGGTSIVSEIASQIKKADFVVANTDRQALKTAARAVRPLLFGQSLTGGLGCGMDARLGEKAAKLEKEKISKVFKGVDLCVLVSSLGGGAGSGASPEFAKAARELGVLTFGIFTLPFKFEGGKRIQIARAALEKVTPNLNAFAVIPNENIFQIIDKATPVKEAFSAINRRLAENLRGLIEMIHLTGLINIDFADLRTILEGRGKLAYLNSASASGEGRVEESIKEVLKSPLNEYGIAGSDKMLFNITASKGLGMKEVEEIAQAIANFNRRAKIIFGVSQSDAYKDKVRISLLAVGCGKEPKAVKSRKKPVKIVSVEPEAKPKRKKPRRRPPQKKIQKPVVKAKKKMKKVSHPVKTEVKKEEVTPAKTPTRRSAVELKKAVEKTEQDMLEQEKKWDIPAFLRPKPEEK